MWLVLAIVLIISALSCLVYALRQIDVRVEIGARTVTIAWLGLTVHVGERIIELGDVDE